MTLQTRLHLRASLCCVTNAGVEQACCRWENSLCVLLETHCYVCCKLCTVSCYSQSPSHASLLACSHGSHSSVHISCGGAALGCLSWQPLLCIAFSCGPDHADPGFWRLPGFHDGVGGVHSHPGDLSSHFHGGWHLQGNCHRCARNLVELCCTVKWSSCPRCPVGSSIWLGWALRYHPLQQVSCTLPCCPALVAAC